MAILTPVDLALLAPDLDVDPGSITAVIQQAQMLVEGADGANRPLEINQFTETPVLNGNGFCKLSRLPILEGESYPVSVSIRGRRLLSSFGLPLSDNQWITLEASSYEFDYSLGEVRLLGGNFGGLGSNWSSFAGHRNRYLSRPFRRPTEERIAPEMRISYYTGFDFQASELSHEAQQIKYATAGIAKLQQSPLASGLKQYNLTDFYSVTYSTDAASVAASSKNKTLLEDLLTIVRKYRPREFAV